MPELPEVETTARGIRPWVEGECISKMVVRQYSLRWPIPVDLPYRLEGQIVKAVKRRAKYILLEITGGHVLIHLGMSGSLRITTPKDDPKKHDHVDIFLESSKIIRFHDPRRFGCVLWVEGPLEDFPLLSHLGPEPLGKEFEDDYLFRLSRGRKTPIKTFIMDASVVVGVGNIYANEALFAAGIAPKRQAGSLSKRRLQILSKEIRLVLTRAIEQGGTTLRDFVGGDGKPGYFSQKLHVYGRGGQNCSHCAHRLKEIRLGQRSSVFCPRCQT